MARQYIVKMVSQKGGVGKTTVAVNLAVYLAKLGYSTLLIDEDTTNPSVGFHLGMERANIGFRNLALGRSKLQDAVAVHAQTGLRVVPGVVNSNSFVVDVPAVKRIHAQLAQSGYNFVVIDTQPGVMNYDISRYVDETIIVTTPDMPSLSSAMRVSGALDKVNAKHSLILNRYSGRRYEVSPKEIGNVYEGKLQAVLPEDSIVPISIEEHIPAMELDAKSRFSRALKEFGDSYCFNVDAEPKPVGREGFFRRLFRIFRR
jgi:MinD-like ATPase involved in chromosome partitioning or flagellar assembly